MEKFRAKLAGARRSIVIWFNGLAVILLGAIPVLQEFLPQAQAYLPDSVYKWAMLGVLIVNLALRFRTTMDLAHK